jgi:hypothetical protein
MLRMRCAGKEKQSSYDVRQHRCDCILHSGFEFPDARWISLKTARSTTRNDIGRYTVCCKRVMLVGMPQALI